VETDPEDAQKRVSANFSEGRETLMLGVLGEAAGGTF